MKFIPLVQVCDFQGGSQPPKEQWIDHEEDGYIRMLQIRDFTQPDKENIEYVRVSKAIKTCNNDDILIARYGASVGKILTGLCGAYNVAIVKTIPDTNKLSKRFLYYYLNSPYFQNYILSVGSRAAQAGFNKDDLCDAQIPDLSLEDQANVVYRLDRVNKLIALRKEQLAKLDQLLKSRFIELFGDPEYNNKEWSIHTLDQLCSVGSSKRIYQNEQSSKGVPFWRISDLVSKMDTGVADSELFIPEEKYLELQQANLVPMPGDILVTSRGTLGRCYIIKDEDRFYFQDGMISWLKNYADGITPLYLQYLFTMTGFRKQIDSLQAGSTVAYLSIAMLKKLRVMVPHKDAQEKFTTFVEETTKTKLTIQASLDKLEVMKKALMQEYFG